MQEAGADAAFLTSFTEVRETVEMQVATLASAHRTAELARMLRYGQQQRLVTTAVAEPFAMAEFEFHRTPCEATQNPFLRAASALSEFGVAQTMVARAGVTDLGAEKAEHYLSLTAAVAAGNADAAREAMARILTCDRGWTLGR